MTGRSSSSLTELARLEQERARLLGAVAIIEAAGFSIRHKAACSIHEPDIGKCDCGLKP